MAEKKPIKLKHRWKPWEKDAAGNKIRYCYDCGACQYYVLCQGSTETGHCGGWQWLIREEEMEKEPA